MLYLCRAVKEGTDDLQHLLLWGQQAPNVAVALVSEMCHVVWMYLASIAPVDVSVSELSSVCICAGFAFLLKLSQKLLQKTQPCCLAFFLSAVGMLLVKNLLLLLQCVYCDWVFCINLASSCGDGTSSLFPWVVILQAYFFPVLRTWTFLSVKTQTEQWNEHQQNIWCPPDWLWASTAESKSEIRCQFQTCRNFDQNTLYFAFPFPFFVERGRAAAIATYHCFYINSIFVA